jgi:hypothetical protein
MLPRMTLVLTTWSHDRDQVIARREGVGKGVPESRLAQLEAVLSEIFPVLKDIKAAREWE